MKSILAVVAAVALALSSAPSLAEGGSHHVASKYCSISPDGKSETCHHFRSDNKRVMTVVRTLSQPNQPLVQHVAKWVNGVLKRAVIRTWTADGTSYFETYAGGEG